MLITLKDYLNNNIDFNVGKLEDIEAIYLCVLGGDETAEVVYRDGNTKKFDSFPNRAVVFYWDDNYCLFDRDTNFSILSHPQWVTRKNSYDGIEIAKEYMKHLDSKECKNYLFSIGDEVEIINSGRNYSTYVNWFEKNKISRELCVRYAYNESFPAEGIVGVVVAIAPHEHLDDILCLIRTYTFGKCYLVSQEGLKIYKD